MGLWAAYVAMSVDAAPPVPVGWAADPEGAPGWALFTRRTADPFHPAPPWDAVGGRMLTGLVLDEDAAVLVGWSDGVEQFRWVFGVDAAAEYQVPLRPQDPAVTAAAMAAWGAADVHALTGLLEETEDFFGVLAELKVWQLPEEPPTPTPAGPPSPPG